MSDHDDPQFEFRYGHGHLASFDDAQRVLDAVRSGAATILGRTRHGDLLVRCEEVTGWYLNFRNRDKPTHTFVVVGIEEPYIVPVSPRERPVPP